MTTCWTDGAWFHFSQRRSQRRPKQKRDPNSTECVHESQRWTNLGAKHLEGTSWKANTPRPSPLSRFFKNLQRATLTFFNSGFCIFPMTLVTLTQDFQKQICFIAQGKYPEFWADFLCNIHTCIAEIWYKGSLQIFGLYSWKKGSKKRGFLY